MNKYYVNGGSPRAKNTVSAGFEMLQLRKENADAVKSLRVL